MPRAAGAGARSTRPVLSDTESRARLIFTGVADECAGMATRRCGGGDIVVCGPAAGSAGLCRSPLGRHRVAPGKRSCPISLLPPTIELVSESCRERRCQYVYVLEVPDYLKK